ncbi:hypothetical protein OJF2_02670 [Aquisphaera giovannonii]|uniref:Uncharacterized protein n=1 Tax=Aquisphaera giovannonii TaxID=406548 RepID=A0A5B9VU03_9BACT|nr:DUF499 domain-containing protein [Aquisphaera giovannonii]QEH31802.1 hypothetical protein OJF2_02670 [Aquisphaera giovannonii]
MAKLRPWYQAVTPREDLRENRPLDASEFAVHLDHIRDGRAHPDYLNPVRFFDRNYMTRSLLDLMAQAARRLNGDKVETSAVFNMATQFGGGKTHALTALYHLARGGEAVRSWRGMDAVLSRAKVKSVPRSRVAVFVGTEFDALNGRGGGDTGEPVRRTPWGELAWQLGPSSFEVVARHDAQGIAPAGDVIRRMLPQEPSLLLMDELMNYVSKARKLDMVSQLHTFLHSLSEEVRGQDHVVLCVSIPASELEMSAEDQRDFDSLKKLLGRLGKAISMSSDVEITEIIRRRLFEWNGFSDDMNRTIQAYAEWAGENASLVSHLGGESPADLFRASYPFHPSVISVFERKWQTLPRFQRTRGVLRLLALWIAWAYREEHRKAANEPLITLGSSPFEDQTFRDALFEELGTELLSVPVTSDIAGKKDSHARVLDREATEAIRKDRLHQKVATVIFMESNGGQSQAKAEASLPEIRAAVGGPDVNLTDVDTVLEGLTARCFYLNWDRNRYRYGLRPNLNQILVSRRGAVKPKDVEDRVRKTVEDLFREGPKFLDRRFFPERSNDVPDRPQLTLVVLAPDRLAESSGTRSLVESIVKECGTSGRTFKSALIFAAPSEATAVTDAARDLLAWEDVRDDEATVGQLDEPQKRSLNQSLGRAKADLREALWRSYRHILMLNKGNAIKDVDLGQINSSMASTLPDLIVGTLIKDDEITDKVGGSRLVRYWPPALTEWPTKAVRDAFYASPALPRLIDPNIIKRTISDAVSSKFVGYARKVGARTVLERFGEALGEHEVEISEDYVLLRAEDAQKLLEPPRLHQLAIHPGRIDVHPGELATFSLKGIDQYGQPFTVESPEWSAPGCEVEQDGRVRVGPDAGVFQVVARVGDVEARAEIRVQARHERGEQDDKAGGGTATKPKMIRWRGTIPPQKWTNFYAKVVSPFALAQGLSLTAEIVIPADPDAGLSSAQVEKIRAALKDLKLDEQVDLS